MTKIHLIIGLPGSGKTHYAKTVLGHLPLVDDINDLNQLPDANEFVITDPNFCNWEILNQARRLLDEKYDGSKFIEIYFENNPKKARANVKRRNDGRNVEGTIKRFAPIYNPPADALEIYSE